MSKQITLKYAQVETLIATMLEVHPERVSALVARFKQLRKLGFPPGVNTGKSARFEYGFDAIMKTVLAFAFMDALVLPQTATEIIVGEWPKIRAEIVAMVSAMSMGPREVEAKRSTGERFLLLEPHGQRHWSSPEGEPAIGVRADYRSAAQADLLLAIRADVIDRLDRPLATPHNPSTIVIDLHSIALWTVRSIVKAGWATLDDIRTASKAG